MGASISPTLVASAAWGFGCSPRRLSPSSNTSFPHYLTWPEHKLSPLAIVVPTWVISLNHQHGSGYDMISNFIMGFLELFSRLNVVITSVT